MKTVLVENPTCCCGGCGFYNITVIPYKEFSMQQAADVGKLSVVIHKYTSFNNDYNTWNKTSSYLTLNSNIFSYLGMSCCALNDGSDLVWGFQPYGTGIVSTQKGYFPEYILATNNFNGLCCQFVLPIVNYDALDTAWPLYEIDELQQDGTFLNLKLQTPVPVRSSSTSLCGNNITNLCCYTNTEIRNKQLSFSIPYQVVYIFGRERGGIKEVCSECHYRFPYGNLSLTQIPETFSEAKNFDMRLYDDFGNEVRNSYACGDLLPSNTDSIFVLNESNHGGTFGVPNDFTDVLLQEKTIPKQVLLTQSNESSYPCRQWYLESTVDDFNAELNNYVPISTHSVLLERFMTPVTGLFSAGLSLPYNFRPNLTSYSNPIGDIPQNYVTPITELTTLCNTQQKPEISIDYLNGATIYLYFRASSAYETLTNTNERVVRYQRLQPLVFGVLPSESLRLPDVGLNVAQSMSRSDLIDRIISHSRAPIASEDFTVFPFYASGYGCPHTDGGYEWFNCCSLGRAKVELLGVNDDNFLISNLRITYSIDDFNIEFADRILVIPQENVVRDISVQDVQTQTDPTNPSITQVWGSYRYIIDL